MDSATLQYVGAIGALVTIILIPGVFYLYQRMDEVRKDLNEMGKSLREDLSTFKLTVEKDYFSKEDFKDFDRKITGQLGHVQDSIGEVQSLLINSLAKLTGVKQ